LPNFHAFEPWLPKPDSFNQVSSRSTDFHFKEELVGHLKENPLTFLNLTKQNLIAEQGEAMRRSADFVQFMINNDHLVSVHSNCFVLYEQRQFDRIYTGWVGLVEGEDYTNGKILKHEDTKKDNERFLMELFSECGIMAEPVLLAANDLSPLESLQKLVKKQTPYSSFTCPAGKTHTLWVVDHPNDVELVGSTIQQIPSLYIADGHHRCASASRYASNNSNVKGFLACIMDYHQFKIGGFYRMYHVDPLKAVKDLQSIGKIEHISGEGLDDICFWHHGQWYQFIPHQERTLSAVEWLERTVVKPILKIEDSGTDHRAQFAAKTLPFDTVLNKIDHPEEWIIFSLPQCTFEDIIVAADHQRVMPPKSTFIEPKFRSGMINQLFL
jgi:uncharacterized protein (DUF1015 family)